MPPQQGGQCIFCQLLDNPQQTFIVHETDDFKAWLDVNPRARGHTMVIPKEHVESAEELGDKLLDMFEVARIVGEKAKAGLGADGFSIVLNNGEAAGQKLQHFYMIMFPRYEDEETAGTPTGAIFRPMEDLEQEDLAEMQAAMEDAGYADFSEEHTTRYREEKKVREENEEGEGEKGNYRLRDRAEFQ